MIEKVDGPGSVRGPQATREVRRVAKPSSAGGTSFVKHLDAPADHEAVLATGGVGNLGAISQIVGMQEVDDALARRKRGRRLASDILDKLDTIRVALLTGSIGKDQLLNLAQMVSARRADVGDPRLAEILDDIELRARVELAKLGF